MRLGFDFHIKVLFKFTSCRGQETLTERLYLGLGRRFDCYLLCMKSEAAFTLTEPSFVLLKTSSMLIFFFSMSIDYLTLFDFWPMVLLNANGLLYDEVNYD